MTAPPIKPLGQVINAAAAFRAAVNEKPYWGNELQALWDALDAIGLPYIPPDKTPSDKKDKGVAGRLSSHPENPDRHA